MSANLQLNGMQTKFYHRHVANRRIEKNYFVTPWAGIILRHSDKRGDLIQFKTIKNFDSQKDAQYVHLQLLVFRQQGRLFPVFQCHHCPIMKSCNSLSIDNTLESLRPLMCTHAVVAEKLFVGQWETLWPLRVDEIDVTDEAYVPDVNMDVRYQIFTHEEESRYLTAVNYKGRISLLYSITKAQKIPFCSQCRFQSCACFKFLKKSMKEERNEDDEHQDYWLKRYRAPIPRADPYAEEDVNFRYRFGYNSTPFIYPLHMDTALAPLLQRPGSVEAHLPEKIIPQYNVTECCPHGNNFDPSDESLRMIFKSMSIITRG